MVPNTQWSLSVVEGTNKWICFGIISKDTISEIQKNPKKSFKDKSTSLCTDGDFNNFPSDEFELTGK